MKIAPRIARPLGTMIAYGFAEKDVGGDLDLARRMGATCLEILPHWRSLPDPVALRARVVDAGLLIHSAHGCWGSQSIGPRRVDLGGLDAEMRLASVEDIRRCIEWLRLAGGRHLVVHPGGLSDPDERIRRWDALIRSLTALAETAADAGVTLCVENMPPGVFPGSATADLAAIITEVDHPNVGLAIDTGHAHLVSSAHGETLAAGPLLRTTHVHDNHGRQDAHLPPGQGTIDWAAWVDALDTIGYAGPVMLECIRQIRETPDCLTDEFLGLIHSMASGDGTPVCR
jgi:sugar phosphate isomerase/epimerase